MNEGLFQSLRSFTTSMHFNGPLYELLWRNGLSENHTSLALMTTLFIGLALIRFLNNHVFESSLAGLTLLLFCASNVHYWYLSWIIPFAVILSNKTIILWSFTIGISYFTIRDHLHTGAWEQSNTLLLIEYLPVLSMLLWETYRKHFKKTIYDKHALPYENIAVIIPTLNEKDSLTRLLEALEKQSYPAHEIIISDASETDELSNLRLGSTSTLTKAAKGRGNQIHHAITSSHADIFLILHSDSTPPQDLLEKIQCRMKKTGRLMGSCGCYFKGSKMSLLNWANHLRAGLAGISFGDQGQFIHRARLAQIGGFPQLPLMEDVELSLSNKEIEQPLYLNHKIMASTRSWEKDTSSKRALLIIKLVALFLTKRFISGEAPDGKWFYKKYYTKNQAN